MRREMRGAIRITGCLLAVLACGGAVAQTNTCQAQAAVVYDAAQGVCWLANANLAADPIIQASLGVSGVNPNGTMDYDTALRWIAALNASNNGAGYLGHNNWQLPVTAMVDKTCADVGTFGGSFGPQCAGSALGGLYSTQLKQTFPASVATAFGATVGAVRKFKGFLLLGGAE